MKMLRNTWLLILALLSALWATSIAGAQELVIEPGQPLPLAVITNRQGAEFGQGHVAERGVLLAQEDRPALTIDGQQFTIEIVPGDTACAPMAAVSVASALIEEDAVFAVIGPNCSTACLAAANIFDSAGFTSISPSCTAPALTEQGFSSFHRLVSSDSLVAERGARYLYEELGSRRLALLTTVSENPVYYGGVADFIAADYAALGGEIVSEASLTNETDFPALIAEIAAADADQIFCACTYEAAAALLTARVDSELAETPFMGAELNWGYQIIDLAGAAAAGVYGIASEAAPSAASVELSERYQERFEAAPRSPYYANAYDAYQLLLDTVLAVGALDEDGALRIDRAEFNARLRATSEYAGVTGTIACDENGECLRMPSTVYQIQDGALVTVLIYEE